MKTIREMRTARGWTQFQLAVKLGVTPLSIYNWESGRSEPTASRLRQIAQLFGVSMDDVALPTPESVKIAA